MVKVLENQLIDLDLMPGLKPSELLARAAAMESKSPEKAEAMRLLASQRAAGLMNEMERKTAGIPVAAAAASGSSDQTPGGFAGGVQGVGMGLANTVGALGKGVGDTLGNTVYVIGSGLVGTGKGVAGGLSQTGKSIVGGAAPAQGESMPESVPGGFGDEAKVLLEDSAIAESQPTDQGEPENAAPRRPRKIELRSGNIEDIKDEPKLQRMSTDDSQKDKWEGVQPLDKQLNPPVQRLGSPPEPTN